MRMILGGRLTCMATLLMLPLAFFLVNIICISFTAAHIRGRKLVIDTDAGGDDAFAILLLLSEQKVSPFPFEIVAITCVYGNTEEKNVEVNVGKILTIAKRHDIKVYAGSRSPLSSNFTNDKYFGEDGLGDFEFEQNVTVSLDYSMHASLALVQLAAKYKDSLTVLTLGPLTNIALACALDPDFIKNVNTFYVMGGSVRGLGNTKPGIEFNFLMDPVSNYIFFSSVRREGAIVLLPWETVTEAQIPKWWRVHVFGAYNSTMVEFLNNAERISLKKLDKYWNPADAVAAAVMLWSEISTREVVVNVHAVMSGDAAGALLVDYTNKSKAPRNTRIIDRVQKETFMFKLIEHLGKE